MRKAPDNSDALAAFIACETEIDAIMARLAVLSAEHFNVSTDNVTWGDVGALGS